MEQCCIPSVYQNAQVSPRIHLSDYNPPAWPLVTHSLLVEIRSGTVTAFPTVFLCMLVAIDTYASVKLSVAAIIMVSTTTANVCSVQLLLSLCSVQLPLLLSCSLPLYRCTWEAPLHGTRNLSFVPIIIHLGGVELMPSASVPL